MLPDDLFKKIFNRHVGVFGLRYFQLLIGLSGIPTLYNKVRMSKKIVALRVEISEFISFHHILHSL